MHRSEGCRDQLMHASFTAASSADASGSPCLPAIASQRTTFFENCWEHHTWQHTKVARPQPMTARIATKAAPLCTNLASSATYATSQARLSSVAPDYEHMTIPKQM